MLLQEIKKIKSTSKELREFGWVVGGAALVFAGVSFWRHGAWNWLLVGIGATLVTAGTVLPAVLRPLQKVWMALALVMGWVMSRVILTLLFFVIVTPLALILRAQGKQFLQLRSRGEVSYWNLRGPESSDPQRCEKQY